MDTITTGHDLKVVPIGTIRRNSRSLRLTRDTSHEEGWRLLVGAIGPKDDLPLGTVVIAPGRERAPIWRPEAADMGIVFGSLVEIGIVRTCEAIVAAIVTAKPLDRRHGFVAAHDCPYAIPMQPQEAVTWIS